LFELAHLSAVQSAVKVAIIIGIVQASDFIVIIDLSIGCLIL
jgi:hypothetical protein